MNRYYEHPTEKSYRSPVYNVRAVPVEKVVANSYNPNVVAPPEMKLLELSIWEDGYTMPCVCYYDAEKDLYELVDGYHRYLVLKTSKRIYEREGGLLPVAVIEKDLSNRMASTIRHNRARGTHNVELMSEIVAELTRARMSDQWIISPTRSSASAMPTKKRPKPCRNRPLAPESRSALRPAPTAAGAAAPDGRQKMGRDPLSGPSLPQ